MNNIEAIAFDLDGTIYMGNTLLDGVLDVLDLLKMRSIKTFFFTNNSSKTRDEISKKLNALGVETKAERVYCTSFALMEYLRTNRFFKPFIIGSPSVLKYANSFGVNHTDSEKYADSVAVCLDHTISHEKISTALNIIRQGKKFIACNVDRSYPVENGRVLPGCGAIVSAIEFCSNKKVDFIIGKPNTYMLDLLINNEQINKNSLLIVGDSYESDILMAKNANILSLLISNQTINDRNILVAKNMFDLLNIIKTGNI